MKEQKENMRLHILWASQLVGNKGAFEDACEKWQETFKKYWKNEHAR